MPEGTVTLAKLLQKAGYATGVFGKWGLGGPGSSGDPLKQGFDRFYGYNCQGVAHHYYPTSLWDNDRRVGPGQSGLLALPETAARRRRQGSEALRRLHRQTMRRI